MPSRMPVAPKMGKRYLEPKGVRFPAVAALRGVSLFLAPHAGRTLNGGCREKLQRQFDGDKLIWSELSMSQSPTPQTTCAAINDWISFTRTGRPAANFCGRLANSKRPSETLHVVSAEGPIARRC
jgi:hypothetical protein